MWNLIESKPIKDGQNLDIKLETWLGIYERNDSNNVPCDGIVYGLVKYEIGDDGRIKEGTVFYPKEYENRTDAKGTYEIIDSTDTFRVFGFCINGKEIIQRFGLDNEQR